MLTKHVIYVVDLAGGAVYGAETAEQVAAFRAANPEHECILLYPHSGVYRFVEGPDGGGTEAEAQVLPEGPVEQPKPADPAKPVDPVGF